MKKFFFKEKISNLWINFGIIIFSTIAFLFLLEVGARSLSLFQKEKNNSLRTKNEWDMMSIAFEDLPNSLAYKGEESWSYSFVKDFKEKTIQYEWGFHYEPFSLWKHRPFETNFLKYKKNGYRNTINAKLNSECFSSEKIYFYGGSAIAGDGLLRDQDLIPSIVSSQLSFKGKCAEIKNWAQSGFNSGNEFTLFLNQIIKGNIPDIAIFYDGFNDAIHKGLFNKPHMAYDIYNNVWTNYRKQLTTRIAEAIIRKSYFATNVRNIIYKNSNNINQEVPSTTSMIKERSKQAAINYLVKSQNLREICEKFNIKCFFILQPTLYDKTKISTEEKEILNKTHFDYKIALNQFNTVIKTHNKNEGELRNFFIIDMTNVFNKTKISLFRDIVHVSNNGNKIIGKEIANLIKNEL